MQCDSCCNYIKEKKIGSGSYGNVFLVHKLEKKNYVLKQFVEDKRQGLLYTTVIEVDILNRVRHPNVLSASETTIDVIKKDICLILDFAESDLQEYIKNNPANPANPSARTTSIMFQLLCGLEYLHSNHIVHRDIKPANILMMGGIPKISDFGTAYISAKERITFDNIYYTMWWRPIEFLVVQTFPEYEWSRYSYSGTASDIWAMGLVIFELIMGEPLIFGTNVLEMISAIVRRIGDLTDRQKMLLAQGSLNLEFTDEQILKIIKNTSQDKYFKDMHLNYKQFILSLLERDPEKRLTAKQALQSPLFKNHLITSSCEESQINYEYSESEKEKINLLRRPIKPLKKQRREILTWLYELAAAFNLTMDIWFLAVDIFDRYRASESKVFDLPLVGIVSLWIASKLYTNVELTLPIIAKQYRLFKQTTTGTTANLNNEVVITELLIMKQLNFKLYRPTLDTLLPTVPLEKLIECYYDYDTLEEVQQCLSPTQL